jgi:hypothetical protein
MEYLENAAVLMNACDRKVRLEDSVNVFNKNDRGSTQNFFRAFKGVENY